MTVDDDIGKVPASFSGREGEAAGTGEKKIKRIILKNYSLRV